MKGDNPRCMWRSSVPVTFLKLFQLVIFRFPVSTSTCSTNSWVEQMKSWATQSKRVAVKFSYDIFLGYPPGRKNISHQWDCRKLRKTHLPNCLPRWDVLVPRRVKHTTHKLETWNLSPKKHLPWANSNTCKSCFHSAPVLSYQLVRRSNV